MRRLLILTLCTFVGATAASAYYAGGGTGSTSGTALAGYPAGPEGPAGPIGPAGATGATGAKGETGAAGAKGETGAAGAKGETGAAGAKGETGPAGGAMNFRGEWKTSTEYALKDSVSRSGSSYVAIKTMTTATDKDPATTPTFWQLVAAEGKAGTTGAEGKEGAASKLATFTVGTWSETRNTTVPDEVVVTFVRNANSEAGGCAVSVNGTNIAEVGNGRAEIQHLSVTFILPPSVSWGTNCTPSWSEAKTEYLPL